MGRRIAWQEMKDSYPDEWVAIIDEEGELDSPYGSIIGEVLVHDRDETHFTQKLKEITDKEKAVDIRYTGEILPDNPVGPVLWQISDTTSMD